MLLNPYFYRQAYMEIEFINSKKRKLLKFRDNWKVWKSLLYLNIFFAQWFDHSEADYWKCDSVLYVVFG